MQQLLRLIGAICLISTMTIIGITVLTQIATAIPYTTPRSGEAWQVFDKEVGYSWEILLSNGLTGQAHQLTHHFASDRFPALSPDHRQVAFVSWRDGNTEIYVLDVQSNELHNLSNHPANDLLQAWSPDGSMLAFVSNRDGNSEIYLADVIHGLLRNLTNHPAHDTSPQWTPDRLALQFRSNRDGSMKDFVMNLGSEDVAQ